MTLSEEPDDLLHREAELLGRYLLGRCPSAEFLDRYVLARRRLDEPESSPRERAVMVFVQRRPWALPALDAASGFLAPRSLLRKRALLMTAVLEASPDHVDDFLPRTVPRALFPLLLARYGASALGKLALGLALWPFAAAPRASGVGEAR